MKFQIKQTLLATSLLALSSVASANAPICASAASDSDNDGWGWENGESCVVDINGFNISPASSNAATIQTASTGQTVCSSSAADPDGDGWGWENNDSCVVIAASGSSSSQSDNNNYCISTDADPDGDGWGWENNQSCVVGSVNTSSTDNNTTSGPAQCSSAASDEDNDGWGWENNQSCVVVAATNDQPTDVTNTPADPDVENPVVENPIIADPIAEEPTVLPPCSIPALDTNNDGIGRENNQDCAVITPAEVRIMAVGDSITHGSSRGPSASYRQPLTTLLTSHSCQFQMVGSQSGNHFHNAFISPHEGYNGHTADQILNGFVDNAGNNEGISVTTNRYQPHVVLLHIGSNDMRFRQDIDETVAEIDQIISVILATESAPVVFLANVIPWWESAAVGATVEVLGDRIEAYATQLNNPRVRLVDVRTGYDRSMMIYDGAHPNATGEQLIAERFHAAYTSAGFCR